MTHSTHCLPFAAEIQRVSLKFETSTSKSKNASKMASKFNFKRQKHKEEGDYQLQSALGKTKKKKNNFGGQPKECQMVREMAVQHAHGGETRADMLVDVSQEKIPNKAEN